MLSNMTVHVIDRDPSVRDRLRQLVAGMGLGCETFASIDAYFSSASHGAPSCVVLELQHPEVDGPEQLARFRETDHPVPLIVTTAHTDVVTAVALMENGAMTVLQKPFSELRLTEYLRKALPLGEFLREKCARLDRLRETYEQLTERQRRILGYIEAGYPNKKIANLLEISQRTVEAERARILAAFGTESSTVMVARSTEMRLLSEAWYRAEENRPALVRSLASGAAGE